MKKNNKVKKNTKEPAIIIKKQYKITSLIGLSSEDLNFLLKFYMCNGSLINTGKALGLSYQAAKVIHNNIAKKIENNHNKDTPPFFSITLIDPKLLSSQVSNTLS